MVGTDVTAPVNAAGGDERDSTGTTKFRNKAGVASDVAGQDSGHVGGPGNDVDTNERQDKQNVGRSVLDQTCVLGNLLLSFAEPPPYARRPWTCIALYVWLRSSKNDLLPCHMQKRIPSHLLGSISLSRSAGR